MKTIIYLWPMWLMVFIKVTRTLNVSSPFTTNDENKNFIQWIQQTGGIKTKPKEEQDHLTVLNNANIISDITGLSIGRTSPDAVQNTKLLKDLEASDKKPKKASSAFTGGKLNIPSKKVQRRNRWEIAKTKSSSSESGSSIYHMEHLINNKRTGGSNISSGSSDSGRKSAEELMDLYNNWDS